MMAKETSPTPADSATDQAAVIHVAPSPHISNISVTTRRMMLDVILGLAPAMLVAVWVFRGYVALQLSLCVVSCLLAEAVFTKMRARPLQLGDLSAVVTGLLLGLSLPAVAPPYVAIIGSFVAIGLGKMVFGGLGYNLFNPAMVGRAFVMLSFAAQVGAPAYVVSTDTEVVDTTPMVLTQATPLTVAKQHAAKLVAGKDDAAGARQVAEVTAVEPLLLGDVNGSLGETSALALLLGGLYLCFRRTAAWEIPVGVLGATLLLAQLSYWAGLTPLDGLRHLLAGAVMLGAFFIATDPVSSPLTPKGKLLFGIGVGALTVLIRVFSGYSEGVMFAVLLMNTAVPLINRWTIPTPLGGPVPENT
jgi:Na+-translocating ferredoxin:NAD+ oxidoreductase subunit D